MSDLTATNCGCGCERSGGCGNNSCLWIILLLLFCGGGCGNGGGCGSLFNNGGCDDDNGCSCIWIILLILCCCGGF